MGHVGYGHDGQRANHRDSIVLESMLRQYEVLSFPCRSCLHAKVRKAGRTIPSGRATLSPNRTTIATAAAIPTQMVESSNHDIGRRRY